MRKLLILGILIMFLPYLLSLEAYVVVTRDLSNFQEPGKEFEVILEITTKENLTAMVIEEYVPDAGNITNCSEEHYKIINNKIEILLFPEGIIKSKNITYSVILNSSDNVFNGTWKSISPDLNASIFNLFCGDSICSNDETCLTCPEDCGVCHSINPPLNEESSSGGGSGGGGSNLMTYSINNKQILQGYTKKLNQNNKIKFQIKNQTHSLKFNNYTVDSATITIFSNPIILTFYIGETKKVNLDLDDYYDLKVTLNSIENSKADISIIAIDEKIVFEDKKSFEKQNIPEESELNSSENTITKNPVSGFFRTAGNSIAGIFLGEDEKINKVGIGILIIIFLGILILVCGRYLFDN